MNTVKRKGRLYPAICSFENIYHAFKKAGKGKSNRPDVIAFQADLEKNLHHLVRGLVNNTWIPGAYRSFYIYESKPRMISAAPFKDRVVHHALTNVLEPVFEPTFIFDLYSNRKGKGTHTAVRRAQYYSRKSHYVLHMDVHKYFPSINRQLLLKILEKKIKCSETLELIRKIVFVSQEGLEQGLPLGNQTSQFFANVYLSSLDHFVKEKLRVIGYFRYVDDMWFFSDSKSGLWEVKNRVEDMLHSLDLLLKPGSGVLYHTSIGFPCLGYRVFPEIVLMKRQAILNFRRRTRKNQKKYASGEMDLKEVKMSLMATMGHFKQASTLKLCDRLMEEAVFVKNGAQFG